MIRSIIFVSVIFVAQISSAAIWNVQIAGHNLQLNGRLMKERDRVNLRDVTVTDPRTGFTSLISYYEDETSVAQHGFYAIIHQFPLEVCNQMAATLDLKKDAAGSTGRELPADYNEKLFVMSNRYNVLDVILEPMGPLLYKYFIHEISCVAK